jgi:dihydrofolate reductase
MVTAARDRNILLAGGGALATSFADAGLLDQMFIAVVPATLAPGKPVLTGRLTSARIRLSNVEQAGQLAYIPDARGPARPASDDTA